jgi:CrcB protein
LLVVVKEFTLNCCPSQKAGQMMTPDRGILLRSSLPARSPSPEGWKKEIALQKYLLIAAGGALGSMARYWVGSTIAGRMGVRFPYGTFVINITACIVLGFSLTFLGRRTGMDPAWRFLIAVGFIGAYSTFSTFEWETLSTLRFCAGVSLRRGQPHSWIDCHLVRRCAGRGHLLRRYASISLFAIESSNVRGA